MADNFGTVNALKRRAYIATVSHFGSLG